SEASWCSHVHQNWGKPCSSSTSGPSPASTTWKRVPPACTARCVHGPSIRTTASSGAITRHRPLVWSWRLVRRGLAVGAGDLLEVLDRPGGPLHPGQPLQLAVPQEGRPQREEQVDDGHDEEGDPRRQPQGEEVGERERGEDQAQVCRERGACEHDPRQARNLGWDWASLRPERLRSDMWSLARATSAPSDSSSGVGGMNVSYRGLMAVSIIIRRDAMLAYP